MDISLLLDFYIYIGTVSIMLNVLIFVVLVSSLVAQGLMIWLNLVPCMLPCVGIVSASFFFALLYFLVFFFSFALFGPAFDIPLLSSHSKLAMNGHDS